MALLGVICPIDRQRISTEDCLKCRMSAVPPRPGQPHFCEYSYEQLKGMLDTKGRETAHISATMLGGCRRQIRLQANEDYYWHPSKLFASFRGTLSHQLMESHPEPGCLYENRFEVNIPGFDEPLTGQIDKVNILTEKITDFKSKDRLPEAPDDKHIMQLNIYRYLVMHGWPQNPFTASFPNGDVWDFPYKVPAEIQVKQLELVYFSMSGVRTFSLDSGTDPLPIYPEQTVYDYIVEGMRELADPRLPEIPSDRNPFGNKLCTEWCPVRDTCIERTFSVAATKSRMLIDLED